MHHAAGNRPGFGNLDSVTKPREVISRRQTARPGADDQYPFAAWWRIDREFPILRIGEIAEEPFDRMDADRSVQRLRLHALSQG